jgi:hypothetical protein
MDFSKYSYKDSKIFSSVKLDRYSMNIDDSIEHFKNMLYCNSLETIENIYGLYKDELSNENFKNNGVLINLSSIFFSNKIIYSIMKENDKIKFLDVRDNQYYEVYNVDIQLIDAPIIYFFCNINKPFIVVQNGSYTDFFFNIFLKDKIILEISCSTGGNSSQLDYVLRKLNFHQIKISTNLTKKCLFFGFNENIGHHIWNEISGLYFFLENKDYHDKIDGIVIGKYDYYNIEEYLRNNYSFNISKYIENSKVDVLPLFLNHFYIHKDVKYLIDKSFNKDKVYFQNIKDNVIEICIGLRTNRRVLINQNIFYTIFIENIIKYYSNYKIKIYFTGIFATHSKPVINNDNIELINGNIIFNKILENIKNRNLLNEKLEIINLIGNSFENIKDIVQNVVIMIATMGTSIPNLLNWIYNKKCIVFGPKECYEWSCIQYGVLQNYNCIYAPVEYVTISNGKQEMFDINVNLFTDFFVAELNKLL